jgi:hypothetical protein
MRKIDKLLGLGFLVTLLALSCRKVDVPTPVPFELNSELKIANSVGIKLQSAFVTKEVAMNVKTEVAGQVTIKIFDILTLWVWFALFLFYMITLIKPQNILN